MQLNGGQLSSFYRNVKVINDPILEPVHHWYSCILTFVKETHSLFIYVFNC